MVCSNTYCWVTFTKRTTETIEKKGVKIAYVTLHVGLGTFRPVDVDTLEDHKMHSEFYILDEENCNKINRTKKNGGKVIAVELPPVEP